MTDRELLQEIVVIAAETLLTVVCNPQYCNKEYAINMIRFWEKMDPTGQLKILRDDL